MALSLIAAFLIALAAAVVSRGRADSRETPKVATSDRDDIAYAVHWWHEWRRRGLIRGKVIRRLRARLRERETAARRREASVSRSPSHAGKFLATCYDLRGRTATGRAAGPGVIAIDPAVIPLGSRVWVSDYGNAVAADTGGAIRGRRIDEWRSSCAGYPNPWVTVKW